MNVQGQFIYFATNQELTNSFSEIIGPRLGTVQSA